MEKILWFGMQLDSAQLHIYFLITGTCVLSSSVMNRFDPAYKLMLWYVVCSVAMGLMYK